MDVLFGYTLKQKIAGKSCKKKGARKTWLSWTLVYFMEAWKLITSLKKKKKTFLPKCSCLVWDTKWTFKRAEENPHSPVSTENRKCVQFPHHNSSWSSHHFYKTENILNVMCRIELCKMVTCILNRSYVCHVCLGTIFWEILLKTKGKTKHRHL